MVTPAAEWNVQTFTGLAVAIAANFLAFVGRSQHESSVILATKIFLNCSYD
jgi:hypothetical protein